MIISAHQIVITLIVLLCCTTESSGSSSGVGESKVMCKEAERRALEKFADGLFGGSKYIYLPSWGGEEEEEEEAKRECCEWIGIWCDDESGHVVSVDLSPSTFDTAYYSPLAHIISSSLVQLQYLNYLDLSGIAFYGESIPSFIGNLSKLRYLDLSSSSLTGRVPPQLGNLSSLEFLNISNYNYDGGNYNGDIHINNLDWASALSSLRVLDLSYVNMATAHDWAHVVGNLPNLVELRLHHCSLPKVVQSSLSLVNSSKALSVLDLSRNSLSGSTFQWLFNFSYSLVRLGLYDCSLNSVSIPRGFENMASLEYLSLASNLFGGLIPESLGNISTLKHLDLSVNNLEGSIPGSFGNMSTLEYLNLQYNTLKGEIPKSIYKICTLQSLLANGNNLSGHIHFDQPSTRCARFSLEYLDLRRNQFTGSLPNFTMCPSLMELRLSWNHFNGNVSKAIGQLSKLKVLDISENSLNGVMSEDHFSKLYSLNHLSLSYNPSLVLKISSHWIPPFQLEFIFLRFCELGPLFPKWLQTQRHFIDLDISHNRISDSVPDMFWNSSSDFRLMNLSYNQINGTIRNQHSLVGNFPVIDLGSNQFEGSVPLFLLQAIASHLFDNKFSSLDSMCDATDGYFLTLLDISHNQLAGEIPDCWSHFNALQILSLNDNNFSGNIPDSLGSLCCIAMLELGNNSFSGNLPPLLSTSSLVVLDVGENRLEGPVPRWIGALENLVILNLRSNQFNGSLPSSLCHLSYIQLLDLSSNNITGKIPNCVGNLTAMTIKGSLGSYIADNIFNNAITFDFPYNRSSSTSNIYRAQVTIMWKGKLSRYQNTLRLVKSIDFSNNKLVGQIPREIAKLVRLIALNLSRNGFTGKIPAEIGNIKSLEVLDLSRNRLSGKIPSSLSELSFMNTLDVSDNNLSGKIPKSTQLQSFDPGLYAGNPELCGDPLPKKCPGEEITTFTGSKDFSDDGEEQDSLITPGFYVSSGLGFVVGFWGICGSLLFVKSWRYAYFKFFNGLGDWFYLMIALRKAKLLEIIKR